MNTKLGGYYVIDGIPTRKIQACGLGATYSAEMGGSVASHYALGIPRYVNEFLYYIWSVRKMVSRIFIKRTFLVIFFWGRIFDCIQNIKKKCRYRIWYFILTKKG